MVSQYSPSSANFLKYPLLTKSARDSYAIRIMDHVLLVLNL